MHEDPRSVVAGAELLGDGAIGDRGATVVVVAKDGSTSPRPIQLAGQTGAGWVVKSGLKPGERVVTDGWQKIMQPGMKVQVKGDRPPAGAPAQAGAKR